VWERRDDNEWVNEVFLPVGEYTIGFDCLEPNTQNLSPGTQCLRPVELPGDGSNYAGISVEENRPYRLECGFRGQCDFFLSLTPISAIPPGELLTH
jgi:hypothetical protein